MKIAILTMGTRGDVQPYAVLGQALQRRGHEVTMATGKNFESLVTSYDINFHPLESDFQAILESEEGKQMLKGNPFVVRRNLKTTIYPLIKNALAEFYTLAKGCDLVLYHVKTLADSFADQFPEKMIRASLIPAVEPTNAFANPSLSGIPIPKIFNKLSYKLSNLSIGLLSKPISAFRTAFNLPQKFKAPLVKNIYAISPSFLSKPKDYAPESIFTGFWFGESKDFISKDLIAFLDAGAPPLLLTFGSMPFKSKFDLQSALLKIARQFNTRLIIVKGWGLDQTEQLEKNHNIKVIGGAPFEKLFPRVKAVIHHGGIGTTAECLRAGIPFMVCPILYPVGDQKFWGKRAFNKGFAVRPIPLNKMTEKVFLESVKELLSNERLYENAVRINLEMKEEKGLENAVKEIENALN